MSVSAFPPLLVPQALRSIQLVATDMDGTLTQSGQFKSSLLHALEALAEARIPLIIVTGRSAGWVSGLASYLPIWGAIAENGGLVYRQGVEQPQLLAPVEDLHEHRQHLAHCFAQLQQDMPGLRESADNRFRLTDWTFDVAKLSSDQLEQLSDRCQMMGWGFTYSTVQCHIKPLHQDKAAALEWLLKRDFAQLGPDNVLTLGDSPNDESLFNPALFPYSVGVANLLHYLDQLEHWPRFLTQAAEVEGFIEVVAALTALA